MKELLKRKRNSHYKNYKNKKNNKALSLKKDIIRNG